MGKMIWVQEAGHGPWCREHPRYYFLLGTHRNRYMEWWDSNSLHSFPISRMLAQYGKVQIYYNGAWDRGLFVPWWLAWLGPILRARDWVARDWSRFVHDLGLRAVGEQAPWPTWMSWGW